MNVHVVLANAMGGVQYCGAFVSRAQAEQHLAKGGFGKNPRVVECAVEGAQLKPNVVYVAQTLNPTMDVHDFVGVYGNFESAQQASGSKGSTLEVTL